MLHLAYNVYFTYIDLICSVSSRYLYLNYVLLH